MRTICALTCVFICVATGIAANAQTLTDNQLSDIRFDQKLGAQISLEEEFAAPPVSARPGVYWFWVDGNVTREGITADLESMKRVGLGAALLFDVSEEIPKGPVRFGARVAPTSQLPIMDMCSPKAGSIT